jgi:hypothetical protein
MGRLMNKRLKQRFDFNAAIERLITEARPDLSGRLCWDTVAFLFGQGLTPDAAAARYLSSRTTKGATR